MIVQFLAAFPGHTIEEVLNMPAPLFFVFYDKIDAMFAIARTQYVEGHLLAKARQYASKAEALRVEREYKKIVRLANRGIE